MKLHFQSANTDQIKAISEKSERSWFQYHEHKHLKDTELRNYFVSKTEKLATSSDTYAIIALSGNDVAGFISIAKDHFDSHIFGFGCYRIIDLIVLEQDPVIFETVVKGIIYEAERLISLIEVKFYVFYGLNNNTQNLSLLFNSITKSAFNYLHTLLTFGSDSFQKTVEPSFPEQKLIIREANKKDAEGVADLAYKSFKYSRFHMDPLLDNTKASLLLKTSAENSILQGFVDIMFIAEIEGKIAGYYSGKKRKIDEFNQTVGDAIISAVDPDYRGMGIFSKLDDHLLKWFHDNTDFAEMGTYLVNYPIHRTWIRKNLKLIRGVHQFSKMVN